MAQIRSGSMNSISSDASATQPHFIVCSGPLQRVFFFSTLRYQRQNAKRHFVCKPESSDSLDLEMQVGHFFDNIIYKLVSYPD